MNRPRKRKPTRRITQVFKQLNRKKRTRNVIIFGSVALILIFFASGPRGSYQLLKFTYQKHELELEIKKLQQKRAELERIKKKIETDPAYIEKIAREKYKMKKKDEQVYQVIEND
jgi:cell division protein DivIC